MPDLGKRPGLIVEMVPVLREGQVCPECGAPVAVLRKEDLRELVAAGAKVMDERRFFVDPCGHRVAVVVQEFGAELVIEKFQQ